ncbi:hypothetical protein ROLI_009220 [Roseobacter fucihabitans]|uniref:Transposase zinc-ribbon domain-containing protein n=1 Tax=Roseobacter fucihabitans TaxID=1537242 RepID=A0ABZ2BPD3_9RHOB|nr:Transposase zinc-ribbon domain protein [Roseobacter litoralis]
MRMSEDKARTAFRQIRWTETEGEPICPACCCVDHYDLKARQVYKCRSCAKQFSITSGTIFASRKLQVRDIPAAIAIFINGAKGYSALQLSRGLSVYYKTAFVLLHKIRESIEAARNAGALSGNGEVDGAYFGGYPITPEYLPASQPPSPSSPGTHTRQAPEYKRGRPISRILFPEVTFGSMTIPLATRLPGQL